MRSTMTATAASICSADEPDMLGATANYHASSRLAAGRAVARPRCASPANLPWDQADLTIKLPRSQMGGVGRHACRRRPLPPTTCRRRCCCPWDVSGRRSSPIRTSRSICSGITRSSIRRRRPISRPASPARRRCAADAAAGARLRRRQGAAGACWRAPATTSARSTDLLGLKTRQAVKAMQIKYGLACRFLSDGGIAGAHARSPLEIAARERCARCRRLRGEAFLLCWCDRGARASTGAAGTRPRSRPSHIATSYSLGQTTSPMVDRSVRGAGREQVRRAWPGCLIARDPDEDAEKAELSLDEFQGAPSRRTRPNSG